MKLTGKYETFTSAKGRAAAVLAIATIYERDRYARNATGSARVVEIKPITLAMKVVSIASGTIGKTSKLTIIATTEISPM